MYPTTHRHHVLGIILFFSDNNELIYYNFCLNIIICRYLTRYFVVLCYSWCSHWLRTWKRVKSVFIYLFFFLNSCHWRDYLYTPISLIKIRNNISNHFVHFLGFYSSNNYPFFINEFETFYKDFGVRCEILIIQFGSPKFLNLIKLVYIKTKMNSVGSRFVADRNDVGFARKTALTISFVERGFERLDLDR